MINSIKATATAATTAIKFIYNDRKAYYADHFHYLLERDYRLNRELNKICHAQYNFNLPAETCLVQIREHKAKNASTFWERRFYRFLLTFSGQQRIKIKY